MNVKSDVAGMSPSPRAGLQGRVLKCAENVTAKVFDSQQLVNPRPETTQGGAITRSLLPTEGASDTKKRLGPPPSSSSYHASSFRDSDT